MQRSQRKLSASGRSSIRLFRPQSSQLEAGDATARLKTSSSNNIENIYIVKIMAKNRMHSSSLPSVQTTPPYQPSKVIYRDRLVPG